MLTVKEKDKLESLEAQAYFNWGLTPTQEALMDALIRKADNRNTKEDIELINKYHINRALEPCMSQDEHPYFKH